MLTIRLTRKGKKNQPFFRIVVVDKRKSSKGGKAVEILGYVDPIKKRKSLKKERIQYWISKGAQPSSTIHNLLVSEKIIDAKKIHVSKIKKSAESAKAINSASSVPEQPVALVSEQLPAPVEPATPTLAPEPVPAQPEAPQESK